MLKWHWGRVLIQPTRCRIKATGWYFCDHTLKAPPWVHLNATWNARVHHTQSLKTTFAWPAWSYNDIQQMRTTEILEHLNSSSRLHQTVAYILNSSVKCYHFKHWDIHYPLGFHYRDSREQTEAQVRDLVGFNPHLPGLFYGCQREMVFTTKTQTSAAFKKCFYYDCNVKKSHNKTSAQNEHPVVPVTIKIALGHKDMVSGAMLEQ